MSLYELIWAHMSSYELIWAHLFCGLIYFVASFILWPHLFGGLIYLASKSFFLRQNHVVASKSRFYLVFHQKLIKIVIFRGSSHHQEKLLEKCCLNHILTSNLVHFKSSLWTVEVLKKNKKKRFPLWPCMSFRFWNHFFVFLCFRGVFLRFVAIL